MNHTKEIGSGGEATRKDALPTPSGGSGDYAPGAPSPMRQCDFVLTT